MKYQNFPSHFWDVNSLAMAVLMKGDRLISTAPLSNTNGNPTVFFVRKNNMTIRYPQRQAILIVGTLFSLLPIFSVQSEICNLPTNSRAAEVKIMSAIPAESEGSRIAGQPTYNEQSVTAKDGMVPVEVGYEPVFVLEGTLPEDSEAYKAPIGLHTANGDFKTLGELGSRLDRGCHYFFHGCIQKDPNKAEYDWSLHDPIIQVIPSGFTTVQNIDIVPQSLLNPKPIGIPHRPVLHRMDAELYLVATSSFLPKNRKLYEKFVQAVVERYDGDGIDDMPGLQSPVKYWQISNEPFLAPNPRSDFAQFVKMTYEAIKKADPDSKVLLAGHHNLPVGESQENPGVIGRTAKESYEQYYLPFLHELKGTCFDIFDIHIFGEANAWQNVREGVAKLRNDLRTCGFSDSTEIWVTETGTWSGSPARKKYQSERKHAGAIVKLFTEQLGAGSQKAFWAWGLMEGFNNVQDNDMFDNTALIYDGIGSRDPGKGVKKLGYYTFQKLASLLKFWNGELPEQVQLGPGIVGTRFALGPGKETYLTVLWDDRSEPEEAVPGKFNSATPSTRQPPVDRIIPTPQKSPASNTPPVLQ